MKVFKMFCLIAATLAVMTSGVQAGPLADATADTLWGIELGGYLDISYIYNFNDPNVGPDDVDLRAFDTDNDEFNVQAFQLYIDRLPEEVGEVGFRADILLGEDAQTLAMLGDFGGPGSADEFTLYQAYISYIAPVGNGLTLDLGRFVAPYGYEVIESPANDNFSRSLLFLSQPKTLTGLRATYPINDQFEVLGAISQGWDQVDNDVNDSISFHAALRWTPMETLYIQNAVSYGPEMAGNDEDYTILYDLVVSYTAMEQLTVGGNFNWSETEDAGLAGADADFWGVALYGRYDFTEQVYAALRAEYIDLDNIAVLLGAADIWELTATLGYEVTDGLEARIEFRHDDADTNIFTDDNGADDAQDTIAAEVIYSF